MQRPSTKSRAVHAGRKSLGDRLASHNCGERQARGERFRDHDNVWLQAKLLKGEKASGSPEAALNLITNQKRIMRAAELLRRPQEFFADLYHAAFTLNHFHQQRGDARGEALAQVRHDFQAN
jgi:hypothetical protein